MKAFIYSLNNGQATAYQWNNSRMVFDDASPLGRPEVKQNGEWRRAKGYLDPNLVDKVKSHLA